MKISIIVAASQNWVIGNKGTLPWHLSDDLKNFKQVTLNKPIIMGRKTFESIGRPLPKRKNIVISRTVNKIPGCEVFSSLANAITAHNTASEIMIIGGSEIYQAALPMTNRIYLTEVKSTVQGDTFFPAIDISKWKITSRQQFQKNSHNDHPFEVIILDEI